MVTPDTDPQEENMMLFKAITLIGVLLALPLSYSAITASTTGDPTVSIEFVEGDMPLEVDFTAVTTGNIASYSWEFSDGDTAEGGPEISHIYATPGVWPNKHEVTVTVKDQNGNTATKTIKVNVSDWGIGKSAIINVVDYGAKLDGVTDDTAAFQAALDAMPPYGTFISPPGTALISETLKVWQMGMYRIDARLKAHNGLDDYVVRFEYDPATNYSITNPGHRHVRRQHIVERLKVDGAGTARGVMLSEVMRGSFSNIEVENFRGHGLAMDNVIESSFYHTQLVNGFARDDEPVLDLQIEREPGSDLGGDKTNGIAFYWLNAEANQHDTYIRITQPMGPQHGYVRNISFFGAQIHPGWTQLWDHDPERWGANPNRTMIQIGSANKVRLQGVNVRVDEESGALGLQLGMSEDHKPNNVSLQDVSIERGSSQENFSVDARLAGENNTIVGGEVDPDGIIGIETLRRPLVAGFDLGATLASLQDQIDTLTASIAHLEEQIENNPVADLCDESLIGYWKLDEIEGAVVLDASGNEHHGTVDGASLSTETVSTNFSNNHSLSFDGANDYVEVLDSDDLDLTRWSISLWVKRDADSGSPEYWVNKSDSTHWDYTLQLGRNDKINHAFIDTSGKLRMTGAVGPELTVGQWYHVVGTFDGVHLKTYLDGTLIADTNVPYVPRQTTRNLQIGRLLMGTPRYNTNGKFDDVRIYNKALTSEEISVLAGGDGGCK